MSLLTIVQGHCQRTGLSVPNSVLSSTDHQIIQIKGLLDEVIEDLIDRWDWTDLQREAVFTTVDGEDQGAIADIAPDGFQRIFNETIFNRTLRLPLFGPMPKEKWQALKALPTTGPYYKYRILRGRMLFNPVGVAGQTCAFEYQSNLCIRTSPAADVTLSTFSADTDECIFPERILTAGLRWKWRSEKGLDYAEEKLRYETLANNAAGRDGTKPRIDMSQESQRMVPGIWVSPGNWPLT